MERSRCLSALPRVFLADMFSMMSIRELGLFEPPSLNWVMFAINSNEHGSDLLRDLDCITVKSLAYWWGLLILKPFS